MNWLQMKHGWRVNLAPGLAKIDFVELLHAGNASREKSMVIATTASVETNTTMNVPNDLLPIANPIK